MQFNIPIKRGFDYKDWPIVRPVDNGADVSIEMAHWEFIPPFIHDADELANARKQGIPWLNAKGETILESKMFRQAALNRRCLVLSTGFWEHRHIPKIGKKGQELKTTEKIPYHITIAQDEPRPFFMAGIWQRWTNHAMNQSADTFAIVTAPANDLMQKIHNSAKRMPTILPQSLAEEWISEGLSEKRIKELATYQYDSEEMIAYPVAKDFWNSEEPEKEFDYQELPPIL